MKSVVNKFRIVELFVEFYLSGFYMLVQCVTSLIVVQYLAQSVWILMGEANTGGTDASGDTGDGCPSSRLRFTGVRRMFRVGVNGSCFTGVEVLFIEYLYWKIKKLIDPWTYADQGNYYH